jgi:hypothetical protein
MRSLFLSYVFHSVVGTTCSIPDLQSYVMQNILIDGKWGEMFEALSILLLYPELHVNIRIISRGMGGEQDNNLPSRFVEVMNIGHVLRDLYHTQNHDSSFEEFLSYDVDTCEQLYLLLGNNCGPFVQATGTMTYNHYYFLQKVDTSSISLDTTDMDTPWISASKGNREVDTEELPTAIHFSEVAAGNTYRKQMHAFQLKIARNHETLEQRSQRKTTNASAMAASRVRESPEERKKRQLQNASAMAASRVRESPEERKKRQLQNASAMAASRVRESPEERKKRQLQNASAMAAKRRLTKSLDESVENEDSLSFYLDRSHIISKHTVKQSDVEHNIEAAVMLNYLNSGYHLFEEVTDDDEQRKDEHTIHSMIKDINNQCCTPQDTDEIITNVRRLLGLQYHLTDERNVPRLVTCASCGMRQFERNEICYHRVPLSQFSCLKCSDEQTCDFLRKKKELTIQLPCENGAWKQFELWKLYSRFEMNGELYYLHPEFVEYCEQDRKHYCELCDACFTSLSAGVVPEFSIANNVDFGNIDRAGIDEPTFLEGMCIAFVRLFVRVLNIKQFANQPLRPLRAEQGVNNPNPVKLGAHCVAFYQETADYESLRNFNIHVILKNALHFHFLDEHGNFDFLMKTYYASNIIRIRPHVLYQYLKVEELLNPLFHDLHFNVPSFDTIKSQVNSISWNDISTYSQNPSICTVDNLFDARHVSDVIDAMSGICPEEGLRQSSPDPLSFVHYSLVTNDILQTIESCEEDNNSPIDYESLLCKQYLETVRK